MTPSVPSLSVMQPPQHRNVTLPLFLPSLTTTQIWYKTHWRLLPSFHALEILHCLFCHYLLLTNLTCLFCHFLPLSQFWCSHTLNPNSELDQIFNFDRGCICKCCSTYNLCRALISNLHCPPSLPTPFIYAIVFGRLSLLQLRQTIATIVLPVATFETIKASPFSCPHPSSLVIFVTSLITPTVRSFKSCFNCQLPSIQGRS